MRALLAAAAILLFGAAPRPKLLPEQARLGLDVGMVCDSTAADRLTGERLDALREHLALGLHRTAMTRAPSLTDLSAYAAVRDFARDRGADVLHGHGAKGGAFARLAAAAMRRRGASTHCFYTPHGGSLNYHPSTLKGRIYMALERRLAAMTSGLVFESAWSERIYRAQEGDPACPVRVIPNGLLPADFGDHEPDADAADVLFVGELRQVKGIDLLLNALAELRKSGPVSAVIVGDGPDRDALLAQAAALGLSDCVSFPGAMPAAKAFRRGRVLAIPSRAESFPYIVLEAAAAAIPLVTTEVGGIPEIVAGTDTRLIPPGDVAALRAALGEALGDRAAAAGRARRLRERVAARFTVERMTRDVVSFYEAVRSAPAGAPSPAPAPQSVAG